MSAKEIYDLMVYIVVDHNNRDYVTSLNYISEEQYVMLQKIVKVIRENPHSHNWVSGEHYDAIIMSYYDGKLTDEEYEFIDELLPYHEYGIHTIEHIRIIKVANDYDILKNIPYTHHSTGPILL
jgi:hypothetical protein